YSRISPEDARQKANKSYGLQHDDSFGAYFEHVYVPTVHGVAWKEQVRWAMDNYWLPIFDRRKLKEITRNDIQKEINRLRLALKPNTVRSLVKVLSSIFRLAEVDGYIPRTPCLQLRLPIIGPSTKKALTFEQLGSLIAHAEPIELPFILLAG